MSLFHLTILDSINQRLIQRCQFFFSRCIFTAERDRVTSVQNAGEFTYYNNLLWILIAIIYLIADCMISGVLASY